ncbi:hypothetical protein Bpla01_39790 [Burkholderia plantarii]|nr:hypothetical protein Bpla01_39790 [Burkholderia plantarii]
MAGGGGASPSLACLTAMNDIDKLTLAASWLRSADGLLVTAGAGMGVDSGLPDFRGPEGFWRAYPALRGHGLTFEDMANPRALADSPALGWGFYGHRLQLYRRTVPHRGFRLLLDWAAAMRHGAAVFTSNVDGQFQKAGFDEARIAECHGSIHVMQCSVPCSDATWPAHAFEPVVDEAACRLVDDPPACPHCGAPARPNILMFGDFAWVAQRTDEQEARLAGWLAGVERPVVIEIGAGKAIPTVRRFSERAGARVIRINPRDADIEARHGIGFATHALATLEALDGALRAVEA